MEPTTAPARGPAATATAPPAAAIPTPPAPRRARAVRRVLVPALVIAAPLVLAVAMGIGSVSVSPLHVAQVVLHHAVGADVGAGIDPIDDQIVWEYRAPRVLLALVTGAALALAGTVLQTLIRNPLADPFVLGIASGASLGAVATLVVGASAAGFLATLGVTGAAFAGAIGTLALVLALGRRGGRVDPARLVLVGVSISSLLQALTSWLQLQASPDQIAGVLFWLLGSVSGATWSSLALPAAALAIGLVGLLAGGRTLDALLLGDDRAASLGVDLSRSRTILFAVSALLTAAAVSVVGGVGFVGLIAPHLVRLVVGPAHRRLLPLAALVGGLFLVLADLAGRTLTAPRELPLSIVTALVGVPVFLAVLLRADGGRTR
ncbi:FecCD family ABC transporter permease [Clavibacter sepedonicus]|uniref:FecCD family ABC transporter permease n=1 Tax=Clavibacter TaxID=1573 RepID=UPI0002ED3216|nr:MULTISPECIES: iron ABC transporter permease [Clavibacter]MBD5380929.1 iron ABC transporter permease [Clavibacter sp.]OQJ47365.1 ABC transporter permease [Clavibacter sepedonicus]UUK66923.1 iron ABC transporter permease [Clavibacter sepedonicus]